MASATVSATFSKSASQPPFRTSDVPPPKAFKIFIAFLTLQAAAAAAEPPSVEGREWEGFTIPLEWEEMSIAELKAFAQKEGNACAQGFLPVNLAQNKDLYVLPASEIKKQVAFNRGCAAQKGLFVSDSTREGKKRAQAACNQFSRLRKYIQIQVCYKNPSHSQCR